MAFLMLMESRYELISINLLQPFIRQRMLKHLFHVFLVSRCVLSLILPLVFSEIKVNPSTGFLQHIQCNKKIYIVNFIKDMEVKEEVISEVSRQIS